MKVTYNWLKEFVEIKIPAHKLADKLTMSGLEVTSLEERDGDFVFEIEVTSNRPDWLSVIGVAREVAAITGKRLKKLSAVSRQLSAKITRHPLLDTLIEIKDKKDCSLYTAKIIKDVKVGPSPDWLKKRLELIGCRSVNNIVDITNYIMFVWGEPLHAFDLDKLGRQSKIIVRRAKNREEIATIDGVKRTLDSDILVIADKERPIAIAGVMGGKDTEVTENTQNVLLEAAVFNPIVVRRGRQKLGLQSESVYRFERGIDLGIVNRASFETVKLIQDISGGSCVLAKSAGLSKMKKKNINLDVATVHKALGVYPPLPRIKRILNDLGFQVKPSTKNNFRVGVPSYRQDVNLEMDLIEEIARLFGYENIPATLPAVRPQISTSDRREQTSLIKNILVGLGLNEVITYSLVDKDLVNHFGMKQANPIEILNPLSNEQEILRPALIPSLARCTAYNLNQKQDYINIFEIAEVFLESGNQPREELVLGLALCGIKSWLFEQGMVKETMGLLNLKGILEALFERLGIKEYNFCTTADASSVEVCIGKETIGIMAGLPRVLVGHLDIKNKEVWVAEIYLDRLLSRVDLKKRFTRLPIYPGISRDISLIIKEETSVDNMLQNIRHGGRPLLREVKIVDYYRGKQIPRGFRGLTISCIYRLDERTLTEEEINPTHSLITAVLVEKFSAQIR